MEGKAPDVVAALLAHDGVHALVASFPEQWVALSDAVQVIRSRVRFDGYRSAALRGMIVTAVQQHIARTDNGRRGGKPWHTCGDLLIARPHPNPHARDGEAIEHRSCGVGVKRKAKHGTTPHSPPPPSPLLPALCLL